MKRKVITALLIGALGAGCLFTGCAGNEETNSEKEATVTEEATPTPTETPTPTPTEAPLKAIGTESEAQTVYKVKLTNSTGADISAVAVKEMSQEAFPANMMAEGDAFVGGEQRMLYFDSASVPTQAPAQEGEKLLTPGYHIRITMADGTNYVLNNFPFGDIEEGEICLEDGVAFVKYKSVSSGEDVSTKEAELTIKANNEAAAAAAAQAAAEAQAQAEAEAAAQAEAEARAQAEAEEAARREAEAAAAAQAAAEEAARQQQQQQQQQDTPADSGSGDSCLNGGLLW